MELLFRIDFSNYDIPKPAYVFDTSALLENPRILKVMGRGYEYIIPITVLRQMDRLKNSSNPRTAYAARVASNYIEYYQKNNKLKIEANYVPLDILENTADNRIIGTALWLKNNGYRPELVSTDRNMRIAATSVGISVMEYKDLKIYFWIAGTFPPQGKLLTGKEVKSNEDT